jgi:hypothetical protein
MKIWSRQDLLEVWERGASRHALDRALLLLASARLDVRLGELADVAIGDRDRALLALRAANFGRQMPSFADCPECATRLAFTLDADGLATGPSPALLEVDGLRVRPPTSRDLAAALRETDRESAERALAERCVVRDEDDVVTPLTAEQIARIESALAMSDGTGDLLLDFVCDACGHAWSTPFDIAAHLWQELEVRARRLLHDVHVLARAYGWTEPDVLALSDERRAAYIDMVGA